MIKRLEKRIRRMFMSIPLVPGHEFPRLRDDGIIEARGLKTNKITTTTVGVVADYGESINFTGPSASTINLPAITEKNLGRELSVIHNGGGILTILPNGSDTIDGKTDIEIATLRRLLVQPITLTQWASVKSDPTFKIVNVNASITANYEEIMNIQTASGTTVTLPPSLSGDVGREVFVNNVDIGNVGVDADGGDLINGSSSINVGTKNAARLIVTTTGNWITL